MIYSASSAVTLTSTSSVYQCLTSAYSTANIDPELLAQTSTMGGAFYIKNAVKFTSTSNTIEYCYVGDTGGAFYIESSTLVDTTSTYLNNAAVTGGAIACKSCVSLSVTQSTFTNHEAYNGGLIYLDSPQTGVILDSVTVTTATAKNNGGLVYAVGLSSSPTFTLTVKNTAVGTVTWTNL